MAERPLTVVPAWRWWIGFVAVLAFAVYITLRAYAIGLPDIFRFHYFDKAAHFVTAGLLAFFLDGALRRRTLFATGNITVPLAAALVLVPAGVEEYLQRFAPTLRTSSFWDFAADVAGVVVLIPLSRQ